MVDRKLPSHLDPEAPASEEEIRESERLRDALDAGLDHELADLARAAASAAAPATLEAAELDAIVAAAIAADAPADEGEAALAEELRAALADPRRDHPLATLAHAARSAHAPTALSAEDNARLVARALEPAAARPPRGQVIRVAFGAAATITALAASVWLFAGGFGGAGSTASIDLARSRSTQPLFGEPFKAGDGQASARIDRIAVARSADFRENRFKRWGVR